MKRLTLLAAAVVLAMVPLASTLTAQDQPTKMVFVDSQALLAAHPAGHAASSLREQAQVEVDEIRAQLDVIQDRARGGAQLTNEETERFNILLATLETVQVRYQADIAAAAAPAIEAVNAAIEAVSLENGYTIVMDIGASADMGLVVYAAEGLDITDAVMARLGN
jgi:outer membrane protein